MILIAFLLGALLVLLGVLAHRRWLGFTAQSPTDYAGTEPLFDMTRHLSGPMISEGVIFGPTGRVAGRFVARMQGSFADGRGTLTESFRFASGKRQERKWDLTIGQNGAFTATADDIIGTARGQHSGATLRMTYRLRLEPDSGGHVLTVTDWLYLMEDGTIMNKSEMRKFGLKVAGLVATIRPEKGQDV